MKMLYECNILFKEVVGGREDEFIVRQINEVLRSRVLGDYWKMRRTSLIYLERLARRLSRPCSVK